MGILDNLYKHSMVHPSVASAYIAGKDVPERILVNEVPDVSVIAGMNMGPVEEPDYLCFTAEKSGATLRMIGQYTEGHENDFALEYSTDGETWQDLDFTSSSGNSISDTLTFDNIGDKVYFRGDNVKGTTDINALLQDDGYTFSFYGGEGTQTEDNQFAVSGDIQTLVSKDGSNKTAGCFVMLFSRKTDDEAVISISTPPSCSATSLSNFCFMSLFEKQESLLTPMDIFNINIDSNNAFSFIYMYDDCKFDMTSDNGITLNGFGDIEYPISVEGEEATINNNFDFAEGVLRNTNGFDTVKLEVGSNDGGSVEADAINSESGSFGMISYYWIPTNGSATAIITATPDSGYHFVKWQSSGDGTNWTDIPGATNAEYTRVFTEASADTYYYKAVFEQNQSEEYLTLTANEDNSSVSMTSTMQDGLNLEYSINGGVNWQTLQFSLDSNNKYVTSPIALNAGESVMFRGLNSDGTSTGSSTSSFVLTGSINASGYLTSIIDKNNYKTMTLLPKVDFLFANNSALRTPPTLGNVEEIESAVNLFSGCSNLQYVMNMDKITFINGTGCMNIYKGCSSLLEPADLLNISIVNSVTLKSSYENCTNLTRAANINKNADLGYNSFKDTYKGCTFNMSDNGTDLNFDFHALPVTTIQSNPTTFSTAYEIAQWMGNINGFTNP